MNSPSAYAQPCDPSVPVVTLNLTGNADSVWISPSLARNGQCCGASGSDVCVSFLFTLDPGASGIIFNGYSGNVPGGSLVYQVDCGPVTTVGAVACVSGPGQHLLTFCHQGSNANQYSITSVPEPSVSADLVLNIGCTGIISTKTFKLEIIYFFIRIK